MKIPGGESPPRREATSAWFAPVFLVPFILMLVVHQWLGLSDALMVAAGPGERPAHDYNLIMVVTFYLGLAAVVDHLLTPARRSTFWMSLKLVPVSILVIVGLVVPDDKSEPLMTSAELAGGIMLAVAATLILVVFVAFHRIYDSSCRSLLHRWAEKEGLTLVDVRRRRPFAMSPFRWRTSQNQTVYRVVARDGKQRERTAWVRCGNRYLGILVDEVEVTWDDENAAAQPSSGTSTAKPAAVSLWDRELDG